MPDTRCYGISRQVFFNDSGSTYLTFTKGASTNSISSSNLTLDVTGSTVIDSSSDITLDAGGDDIYFKSNNETSFHFDLENSPVIKGYGDTTLGTTGGHIDLHPAIDAAGTVQMRVKDNGQINIKEHLAIGVGSSSIDTTSFENNTTLYVTTSSGYQVAYFKNTNDGGNGAGLDIEITKSSGNLGTSQAFIRFLNADGDQQGEIRPNGSGGTTYQQSFTGQHASVINSGDYLLGMIVESSGYIWGKGDIETALPKVQISNTSSSKKVYGVIAELQGRYEGFVRNFGITENETHIEVNSIGEGLILVTDINGNIENGDLIVSTEIPGYGGLQSDDLFRSCTVAKCTEDIDWSVITDTIDHNGTTYKWCLAACTYHCG